MKRLFYLIFLFALGFGCVFASVDVENGLIVERPYLRVKIHGITEPIDVPMYDGMDCTVDPIALRVHGPEGWLGFEFPHVQSFSYITKMETVDDDSKDFTSMQDPLQGTTSVETVSDGSPAISMSDYTLAVRHAGQPLTCKIFSVAGTKVYEQSGFDAIDVSLANLASDIYIAVVNDSLTFKICVR